MSGEVDLDLKLFLDRLATLSREHDFPSYFELVATSARDMLEGDGAAFILAQEDQQHYLFFHGLPEQYKAYGKYSFPLEHGISGAAISRNAPVFTADYPNSTWAIKEFVELGLQGSLAIPVHGRDFWPIGTLVVSWFGHCTHHPDSLQLQAACVLADMLGMAWHRMELANHLDQMASTDSLTGVYNRYRLTDRIRESCAKASRRNRLLAVVMLDIDGFKDVNDSLGHLAGDRLLREVVSRLRDILGSGDVIVRYAGDEFVLLLGDIQCSAHLDQVLLRVKQALNLRIRVDGREAQVSTSVGATLYPLDPGEPELLIQHADLALYRAKSMGGNSICHHDVEIDNQTQYRQFIRGEFPRALEKSELLLYWQPIVSLQNGECVGAEALLRWQHPEKGLLLPGDFLDVLENSPFILETGRWVLHSACSQGEIWRQAGFNLDLHINLSAREIERHQFCQEIRNVLDQHPDLPAYSICIEIVERTALRDIGKTRQLIADCRDIGVHFALDDFGTGPAALQYLLELDCDQVKIDRSFVIPMMESVRHRKMVLAIIEMSHALGVRATAEGIETLDALNCLREMGLDRGQGFVLGRPMPAHEFGHFLAAQGKHPLHPSRNCPSGLAASPPMADGPCS